MFWIGAFTGYWNEINTEEKKPRDSSLVSQFMYFLDFSSYSCGVCYASFIDNSIKHLKVPLSLLSLTFVLSTYFSKKDKKIEKLNKCIPHAITALYLVSGTYAAYHRKKEFITTLGFLTGTLLGKYIKPKKYQTPQDILLTGIFLLFFPVMDTLEIHNLPFPTFKITDYVTNTFTN